MSEVLTLLREVGFEVVRAYYSIVNDLAFIDANLEEYLKIASCKDLLQVAIRKPTKQNILRLLAYPIVKLRSSLRQLIVVVAVKTREPIIRVQEIWG